MGGWTSKDRENIEWDGTIGAKKFKGDGALLTGVAGAGETNTASNIGTESSGAGVFFDKSGVDLRFKRLAASGANIIVTSGAHSVYFDISNAIRLGLNSSPSAIVNIISNATNDGTDNAILQIGGGGDVGTTRGSYMNLIGNEYGTSSGAIQVFSGIGDSNGGFINFYTDQGGGAVSKLYIARGGNIGINTENPTAKLDVIGNISGTKILTQAFQMFSGASLNKVLTSDSTGNAEWGTAGTGDVSSTEFANLSGAFYNHSGSIEVHFASGAIWNSIDKNTNGITTLSGQFIDLSGAYYAHETDITDPHGITLSQTRLSGAHANLTGSISGGKLRVIDDQVESGAVYVANIVFGSSATPPTASTVPEGTIYVQYKLT